MVDRSETGKDGVLIVGNQELYFTNCDYSIDYELAEDDWNDEFNTRKTYVSGSISGSFEWAGSNPPARDAFINPDGSPIENVTLQVNGSEERLRARRVKITNFDRAFATDSTTDGTVEWEADRWRFPS